MREGWKEKSLSELGFVGRGKSRHRPRNADFLYGDKYPFIQTADIKSALFRITSYSQMYSDAGLQQSKLWPINTLCITIAANIADTAILGVEACFPDSVIGFLADEKKSDVRFVKYSFDILQGKIKRISQGAAQDNLSLEKLQTIKFLVPPLSTQQKIADILSAYDDLIENNLKRIQLLEEQAQLMYEEWFVRMKFPGHEDAMMNAETALPEGWERVKISFIADYLNGYAFKPHHWKSEGFPIIKIKEMKNGVTPDTPRNNGLGIHEKYLVKAGDIIFSWSATLEVIQWVSENGLLNQHLFKVTPKNGFKKSFVYLSLKNSVDFFDNLTTGATMKHIKRKELDFVEVNSGPEQLMQHFENLVNPLFELILNLQKQNRLLQEARDLLLPRLMMGIIDVDAPLGMVAEERETYLKNNN